MAVETFMAKVSCSGCGWNGRGNLMGEVDSENSELIIDKEKSPVIGEAVEHAGAGPEAMKHGRYNVTGPHIDGFFVLQTKKDGPADLGITHVLVER